MKLMGLSNWLHWSAWFVKYLLFLAVIVAIETVLFVLNTGSQHGSVISFADPTVIFVFLLTYSIATISFCFAISTFFSKGSYCFALFDDVCELRLLLTFCAHIRDLCACSSPLFSCSPNRHLNPNLEVLYDATRKSLQVLSLCF